MMFIRRNKIYVNGPLYGQLDLPRLKSSFAAILCSVEKKVSLHILSGMPERSNYVKFLSGARGRE